jgi:hypothetical protein
MAPEREKPEVSRLFCPNAECLEHSQFGRGNLRPRRQYGKARRWMIECRTCGKEFSERRGTVFLGLHASEEVIWRTLHCVAEGNGIRATARIQGVNSNSASLPGHRAPLVGTGRGALSSCEQLPADRTPGRPSPVG